MTNGRVETLRILANAFDELEQLRCRLRDDSEHVMHAMDAARADERAAVVAWLRKVGHPCCHQCNDELAADIDRGDHRREEKP